MKTFGLNYDIKPEYVEAFTDYSINVINLMQDWDGHIETRLFIDAQKPNSMMIYSNWETADQFKQFMKSDAFKGALGATYDMLEGMPSHKVYEETDDLKQ
ncbi:MAG: antibiotic biosynthesis monooxygenase family protein [Candidatus Promineifilaceae bacterium]|jgi:quinol monooxygenase YgiN